MEYYNNGIDYLHFTAFISVVRGMMWAPEITEYNFYLNLVFAIPKCFDIYVEYTNVSI